MGETVKGQSIMLNHVNVILTKNAKSFGDLSPVLFVKHYHEEVTLLLSLRVGTISSV